MYRSIGPVLAHIRSWSLYKIYSGLISPAHLIRYTVYNYIECVQGGWRVGLHGGWLGWRGVVGGLVRWALVCWGDWLACWAFF